jgi:hypothetical protein
MPGILIILIVIGAVGWVGLKIKPAPFPAYPEHTPELETIALPDTLPAPVKRFYETIVGDQIPVITSAVLTARATLRFMGIVFPARFRFIHEAGRNYRHYIEATIWGIPILKVNECFLDNKGRMELPFGVIENEPKIDSAANLGLWGESMWIPTIFITDPRVRWEAVDDMTARLIVPFGDVGEEDGFTVTFDKASGLMTTMETLRWKDPKDAEEIRWTLTMTGWETFHGIRIPARGTATWESEGTPWLIAEIEDMTLNVDVSTYIRAKGL